MPSNTVHVSNISPNTTEKEIEAFFSFCGKIASLSYTAAAGSATVTFERPSAANTALLLDNTSLGGSSVSIRATPSLDEMAGGNVASHADEPGFGAEDKEQAREGSPLRQEDKPRSAIFAEYLSAGYVVGDTALQKGIELDRKAGISSRFTNVLMHSLQTIDSKIHAIERAKSVGSTYNVTEKLRETQHTLAQYFEQATNNPMGKRIRDFYAKGAQQVMDIHQEAKRLAELKKQHANQPVPVGQGMTKCGCSGNEGVCVCKPDECVCDKCAKKNEAKAASAGKNEPVFVGPEKTTCGCGGNEGTCGCPPGKCACEGCMKGSKGYPQVGTAQAGTVEAQMGHEDIRAVAKDMTQ